MNLLSILKSKCIFYLFKIGLFITNYYSIRLFIIMVSLFSFILVNMKNFNFIIKFHLIFIILYLSNSLVYYIEYLPNFIQ